MISDTVTLALIALSAGAIATIPPTILAIAQLKRTKEAKNEVATHRVKEEEGKELIVNKLKEVDNKAVEIKDKVNGNFMELKSDLSDAKNQIKILTERLISASLALQAPAATTIINPPITGMGERVNDVKSTGNR